MNDRKKKITIISIAVPLGIIITIATLIWAASAKNQRYETACETVERNTEKIEDNTTRITKVEKAIIEINTNQKHIITSLEKIDRKIDRLKN